VFAFVYTFVVVKAFAFLLVLAFVLAFVLVFVLGIVHAYLLVLSTELAPVVHVPLFVLVTLSVVAFEIQFVNVTMSTFLVAFETFV